MSDRSNGLLVGVIADDVTGASDIAGMLARGGMRVRQTLGLPGPQALAPRPAGDMPDAIVVSLKTRSIPPGEAVARSLEALERLREAGARQIYFKYCSTFDSTPEGNIGPVAAALAGQLGVNRTVFVPALPENGRTVYQGHLFVHDRLLSESGMEHHPLTPMTDPDIRRWLGRQVEGPVGHIAHATVEQGPEAVAEALRTTEARWIVVDTLAQGQLDVLARAFRDLPLVTGGSGLAVGLPAALAEAGKFVPRPAGWTGVKGPAVCLAGSCSRATREQVARHAEAGHPVIRLDAAALIAGRQDAEGLAEAALARLDALPLIASTAEPEELKRLQARFGRAETAAAIEAAFAAVARALLAAGVRRFVCAGGETSGAIVEALGVADVALGPEIDPGVPALVASDPPIALALKSGNFGAPDFFEKAAGVLGA